MTKADLIESMAAGAGLSKTDAGKALDAAIDSIVSGMKKGEKITIVGFGTFSVTRRKARKGRNPKTGEAIDIPASNAPKFSPGRVLKDALK